MSKRLIPKTDKLDNSKRNYSSIELTSEYDQNPRKKLNLPEQPAMSPISSNMSPFPARGAIDAQTYVDAQSNGFTKRIVRYEEENKQSKLSNRLYKRTGDFPIVHLDKPKLVLTPNRSVANPAKMARIGQPDPSNYRSNVRAEILRNGMMLPPISADRHDDVGSVRVDPLDALKEISRKRIHCEDTINQIQSAPIEKDSTDSIPNGTNYNSSKRQRTTSSLNSPSSSEINKKGNNSSKCNEILSSLSSSSYMLTPSSPTVKRSENNSPSSTPSSPQAKRLQLDKQIESPTIEPAINSVPKTVDKIVPEVVEKVIPTESTKPKLMLFNRPYSANSKAPPVNNEREDECNIPFVKPRPMTARSRESVDNWLKIKPDEKRRLALMLSYLSGDVDGTDTVDNKEKSNETPVSKLVEPIVVSGNLSKGVSGEKNATGSSIPITAASTAQVNISSTTTPLLPSKPVVTFNLPPSVSTTTPVSLPVTTTVPPILPTIETNLPATGARSGGFSFASATNDNSQTTVTSSAVLSTPVSAPSTLIVAQSTSTVTSTNLPVTSSTNVVSKESTPNVTFTFHPPKPKDITPAPVVSSSVEPAKTFSFGNADSKAPPAFGVATPIEAVKPTTSASGTLVEPKKTFAFGDTSKTSSFATFGQTASAGNNVFGKTTSESTVPSSAATPAASIFGSTTSQSAFNKADPPSFGSVSVPQKSSVNDKPAQSNMSSAFAKNGQTPIFGNAAPNNATTNTQKQIDPRTSTNSIGASFTSNQINTTTSSASGTTNSFTFGAATTATSAFQTGQSALSSSSAGFGSRTVNTTTNVFGSMVPQTSAATATFGSSTNTSTNLFNQAPKVNSIQVTVQNSTEPDKNTATRSIFGSSEVNPSPTFSFSSNTNQANTNQANTNNIFGGQTQAASGAGNAFTFGGSNQKSDQSTGSSGTTNSFTFSGNSGETAKPVAFGTKNVAPTFGSSNVTDTGKGIGFATNTQPSATNLFGSKPANEAPKVFSFGSSSNTQPASATSGASAFGTSSFGNSAAPNVTSFGGANATPIFGSNATPTFGANNAIKPFGGTNATPSFGAINATPTFGSANVTQSFGSSTQTFGNSNATPTFGGANATPTFGTNAPPSFGITNNVPTFGTNNTTPSFGTPTPTFGSPLNSSNSSGFGGAPAFTTSTGTADVNKTFNFTGNDPTPSPVPNLFNIGPGSSPAPRGRTIRTATRRAYR